MPIVHIPIENPAELLNTAFLGVGALGRLELSATGGGAGFAEVTTFALVATERLYTVYRPVDPETSWYRVRYTKSDGTAPTPYSAEWQAGDESGGELCSLYDVKQRLFGADSDAITNEDENLISFIRQVSFKLQNRMGRRFAKTPLSGEDVFYFDVERTSRELSIPAGIASMSVLEVAQSSQPTSGGTFTTVAAADWFLRPLIAQRDYGWPATRVCIIDTAGSYFHPGHNTVRATMALGWTAVPDDIAKLAEDLVVEAHRSRGSDGGGPSFTINLDGSRSFQMANDRGLVAHYALIPTDGR